MMRTVYGPSPNASGHAMGVPSWGMSKLELAWPLMTWAFMRALEAALTLT